MGSCWRMRPVDRPRARADHQSVIWYWPHLVCSLVLVVPLLFWFFSLSSLPRDTQTHLRPNCCWRPVRVRASSTLCAFDKMQLPREPTQTDVQHVRPAAGSSNDGQPPRHLSPKIESTESYNNNNNGHSDVSHVQIFISKFVRSLNSTSGDATVGVRFVRRNLRCALTWEPARAPLAIALRFWTISFQGKKNFFSFFRSPSEGPGFFFDFFVPTRCDLAKKWNFFFKKKKRGGKIV